MARRNYGNLSSELKDFWKQILVNLLNIESNTRKIKKKKKEKSLKIKYTLEYVFY